MRVMVCGGTGFIGRHIVNALVRAGHDPVAVSRHAAHALDFVQMTTAASWLPHLQDVDAVVNAVGALRDVPGRPLATLHTQAPIALFDACAQAGVRRVVQLSALGADRSDTAYARTKRAADEHLLALNTAGRLQGVVLRPSIVFGAGGASSELFLNLARLPALLLPAAVQTSEIQPVAVRDLADAAAQLALHDAPVGVLEIGGPQPLTLGQFIASLRAQMKRSPAHTARLPQWLAAASARVGDHIPSLPWCSETLAMLQTRTVTDPATLAGLLDRAPVAPDQMLATLHPKNRG